MACRLFRLRGASRVLLRFFYSDSISRRKIQNNLPTSLLRPWLRPEERHLVMMDHVRRSSTTVTEETNNFLASQAKVLTFIKSTFDELEGQNHRWLNNVNGCVKPFNQDGMFLVLLYKSVEDSSSFRELSIMFERVKLLQQRYPKLNVFALQCGSLINSVATHSWIIQTVMKEYITYPILVSEENFMNMTNDPCYLLFEGSSDHFLCLKCDEEPEIIVKVIESFDAFGTNSFAAAEDSKVGWQRQHQAIKEPYVDSFRNLFLCHPGCISVDEKGNRLFISDSNHHRIIISDGSGKIVDFIGSSPGFEDGEFEFAKLLRPAASYYYAAEDSLYFVDSENHAIRRADLEKRVLETVYPITVQKTSGMWSRILDKLGLAKEVAPKSQEIVADRMTFPWHLIKIEEDDLLIINRNFETSWIISMATGEKRKVLRGVIDLCERTMMERVSLLKGIYENWSSGAHEQPLSLEGIPYAGHLSSIASFDNYSIFCDSAGQRVLKFDRESKDISCIHFSNFGVLGLPYWLVFPLERVCDSGYSNRPGREHIHNVNVLPGRCDIRVYVDIPVGTELVAPLGESCIWRQARGSAAELSGLEESATDTEKVGVAQQWFDELDNLAFTRPEVESEIQGEDALPDRSFQDSNRVHFDCAVNISPGKSEVVVSAVLYLKIKKTLDDDQKALAMRILDYRDHEVGKPEEDASIKLLLDCGGAVRDIVFMKPLHLRLLLECGDHPAAETNKETVLTDSSIKINICLE
ncbi:uncharacterized protein [Typha angustifolia]|uniref:uncharacterized protein isoform X2 n=1 Tax=Typha angustifolia TaxID=59011 RepID=UPI003C2C6EAB